MDQYFEDNYHTGYYEDALRSEQQGRPLHLRPNNANPYIQDDPRKNQRFAPLRTAGVPLRTRDLERQPLPLNEAAAQQTMCPLPSSCNQTPEPFSAKWFGLGAASANQQQQGLDPDDMLKLVVFFLFVMFVWSCMYFWTSLRDLQENLTVMRTLMTKSP